MSDRTTEKQLRAVLAEATELTGLDLSLEAWSPGDRFCTRYRVTHSKGSRELSRYYFGKGNTYDALRLLVDSLRAMNAKGKGK